MNVLAHTIRKAKETKSLQIGKGKEKCFYDSMITYVENLKKSKKKKTTRIHKGV